MDGFFGYSQILMAPEDMEKTSFITEWGTYCYRVMPFGLKNVGATYQRTATTLFHDMMHWDVEVYVDEMIVKSRDRADHLAALERFFERIRQFRSRLNPKKCIFRVTSRKLLGYMVSERDIKTNPDRLEPSLTCLCQGLRDRSEASWCQCAFERIREYLLSPPILVPPTPDHLLLLYLPALVGRRMRWLALLTEFDIHYVTEKSIRGSIVADNLASLPVSNGRAIDDDFLDEDVPAVTSLSDLFVWHSRVDILPRTILLSMRLASWDWTSLELGIRQIKNRFPNGLVTLASMIDIPVDAIVCPLLIESRSIPTYCCLIDEIERSTDEMLLLCLDHASVDRVMKEVHAGVCGPHMGGHMLARKIMRTGVICTDFAMAIFNMGYKHYWEDLSKSFNGHEFILVAIDYFTKWVEAASMRD
ncbi:Retrovirus-related Pol polyprotein from transposon 17.6 [Vitis vinifera]|uniref:Retrovirus-related Pol polyprotein from transposon 17.6 n=1 Tax=Vitis vinifera TaxID=29760 RepID=A0A438G828_VITVI|nr:Retrovirus-related Pol polyprotein from transposon 17.6 [Vitis vinifera]